MVRYLVLLLVLLPMPVLAQASGKNKTTTVELATQVISIMAANTDFSDADETAVRECYVAAFVQLDRSTLQALLDSDFKPSAEVIAAVEATAGFKQSMMACNAQVPSMRHVEVVAVGENHRFVVESRKASALPSFAGGVAYNNGRFTIAGEDIPLVDYQVLLRITVRSDGTYEMVADPAE